MVLRRDLLGEGGHVKCGLFGRRTVTDQRPSTDCQVALSLPVALRYQEDKAAVRPQSFKGRESLVAQSLNMQAGGQSAT